MNGGQAVVAAVQAAGVDAIFAIHGVQIDPIFQGCLDTGVRLVDVRHEATAGFAAEAYARSGRGLGVAAVCPGPGFTNVMTSIANASLDRTPVVYLVSSNPPAAFDSNGLQTGIDHVALAAPLTKWGASVTDAADLSDAIGRAISVATTPPFGPVVLDVAADVLAGPCTTDPMVTYRGGRPDVGAAIDLLAGAERPAVALGERPSPAVTEAFRELLRVTGMPCFSAYGSLGVIAEDDEHHGGTLYQLGRLGVEVRPDVLLVLGQPLGFDTPGLRDGGTAWGVRLVRVDSDPTEVKRFADPAVGVVAGTDAAIRALATAAPDHTWPDRSTWRATVRRELGATRAELGAIEPVTGVRLHPYAAARVAADVAFARGAVVVGDGAVCKHWLHDALRVPAGGRYLTHGRLGAMGQGFGAAIGAAYATDGPVVCVTGDGAAGFALGELEAIARHRLTVVIVVMNNARWGASMGFQLRHGGTDRVIGTELSDANYDAVARSLGGDGIRVALLDDLRAAIDGGLHRKGLTVVNVSTHSEGPPAPELPLLMSHP
jgi:acetolactate synthase-1/2/3 large subunit